MGCRFGVDVSAGWLERVGPTVDARVGRRAGFVDDGTWGISWNLQKELTERLESPKLLLPNVDRTVMED